MSNRKRWSRILSIAGLVGMILGAVDPLEGSVVIVAGSLLSVIGLWMAQSRYFRLAVWAFILTAVGVAILFGLSAVGGIGGDTGRPMWLMVVFLPYPVGWVLGLIAVIRKLREKHDSESLGTGEVESL
jgi:hypothetical protein